MRVVLRTWAWVLIAFGNPLHPLHSRGEVQSVPTMYDTTAAAHNIPYYEQPQPQQSSTVQQQSTHPHDKHASQTIQNTKGLRQAGGATKATQPDPMKMLLEIFNDDETPKHPELGQPFLRLSDVRAATRSRLNGKRWDKVGGRR